MGVGGGGINGSTWLGPGLLWLLSILNIPLLGSLVITLIENGCLPETISLGENLLENTLP